MEKSIRGSRHDMAFSANAMWLAKRAHSAYMSRCHSMDARRAPSPGVTPTTNSWPSGRVPNSSVRGVEFAAAIRYPTENNKPSLTASGNALRTMHRIANRNNSTVGVASA